MTKAWESVHQRWASQCIFFRSFGSGHLWSVLKAG